MKLQDIRIGTQLRLGLSVILALVVGFGGFAWRQTHQLWSQTEVMYDHSLQVNTAVGELESDVLAMQVRMQALMLQQSEPAITATLQDIETYSADAMRRFEVLFDRYGGPREDITNSQGGFVRWNVSREEGIRLLRAGKAAEAMERTVQGAGRAQVDVLISQIHRVEDFARNEGNALYRAATAQSAAMKLHLAVVVAMLEPQAREKNLTLLNRADDDLPPLASARDKCRHILQNLVANALKFTNAGSVEIAAQQADSDLLVVVRDTGIGIAADQLPHIFDEFRQADDSASRSYGGSGLGLAIARKYALLLGGDIRVESTPGMGSTFTLRLPLAAELPGVVHLAATTAHAVASASGSGRAPRGCGRTLLWVEDNEPAIIQLTDILDGEGYRVEVARNGREALSRLGQALPDAMILDLMMPEADGFQVLKAIRSEERTARMPVLILTAKHVTPEELSVLEGNHIHQLIQKGDINKDGLLATVARMVPPPPTLPPPTPPPSTRRRPTRPGKPLILVVEDNPDNLRTSRALLDEHYQVVTATDGQAGLAQARLHQPDLILSDLAMPGTDGIAALAAMRHDPVLCDIPVVAVTASAMKGDRERILAQGFDGYISKPVAHETLTQTLREFLDPAWIERRRFRT